MNDGKKITVIVATHKDYRMPEDEMYLPVYVGAAREDDKLPAPRWFDKYQRDDEGENISDLNPGFCELTGLYWLWKNADADYKGLAQYRRHFASGRGQDKFDAILGHADLEGDIPKIKVFVPKRRNYYIESLYSHYAHTHFAVQLDATAEIIKEHYPDYFADYNSAVNKRSGYMFNMMIMENGLFDDYCSWLFDILFKLEKELGVKKFSDNDDEASAADEEKALPVLSDFQARFYGRISEIIFNVWLENKLRNGALRKDEIKELPYVNMEGENWGKKVSAFLKAKFAGRKYGSSF